MNDWFQKFIICLVDRSGVSHGKSLNNVKCNFNFLFFTGSVTLTSVTYLKYKPNFVLQIIFNF